MERGVLLILFLLSISFVTAADGDVYHLKLLAVAESGEILEGSDADLYLELKEGSGRVFLETFPLTKLDTQISTRFAKEIACKNFKLKCDKKDFIFTIQSKSNIIGGPSAGAAIAALTTIATLDLDYKKDIAITGTINSGGIIGHVGGVKQKVEAANRINLKKVLIAKGNSYVDENETDIITYAKENLSIEVLEVESLDQVVFELTGINLNHKDFTLIENPSYTKIMNNLNDVLCKRSDDIELEIYDNGYQFDNGTKEDLLKRKGLAENATLSKDYYSSASYCFGLNINLKTYLLQEKELKKSSIKAEFTIIGNKIKALERKLDEEKIETITDLQTFMVVKERVNDVKDQIKNYNENNHSLEESYSLLSYAEERLFSAISWMQFFAMDGKTFLLNKESLKNSCMQKIFESEERNQYASLFLTQERVNDKILKAREALNNEEYELCLITASQAKAESNAVLSSLGLRDEILDEFIESKRKVTERIIAENTADGMFPILGYSYYQYANSLKNNQKFSSLLYLEYALEMSEISIYFPEEKSFFEDVNFDEKWTYLIIGFIGGLIVAVLLFKNQK